jgi:hypothetical protein
MGIDLVQLFCLLPDRFVLLFSIDCGKVVHDPIIITHIYSEEHGRRQATPQISYTPKANVCTAKYKKILLETCVKSKMSNKWP